MTGAEGFVEVAARVYVLRYPVLDVNVTLVVGDGAALLVDTLSTEDQAGELRDAVRRVTAAPLRVVNTHHHFDHCFGNAVLADADTEVWAAAEAARLLRERGEALRREWYAEWAPTHPDLADGLAAARLRPPDHTVHVESTVDIGGRPVVLRHLGRGHTAGDLVVHVPDADAVVAGDLVEEGGPPMFGDAYPLDWPATVAALLALTGAGTAVVPGHGAVVDRAFVQAQHAELTALEWLIRDGHADRRPQADVVAKAPFGPQIAAVAVARGYAELSGRV
jgi:glyoxylase-like metal-dependent hydrolase (beta-lactamase superfamily II)